VELLIVLVILAIMTTVAITATDSLVDQGRYDATQRTLTNIQDAIVGPVGQREPDGSLLITGFVADMGRLPVLVNAASDPLRELWDPSSMLPAQAYALQNVAIPLTPTLSYTMSLPCGWRGPYLRLPTGTTGQLIDGWGNPFDSLTAAGALVNVGAPVNVVRSRGQDNAADPAPLPADFAVYNRDQYTPDQLLSPPVPPLANFTARAVATAGITVQVKVYNTATSSLEDPQSSDGQVTIVLIEPANGVLAVPTVANLRRQDFAPGMGPTTPASGTFPNVTIGPRAIQAFQYDTATNTLKKKSAYTPLMMMPGGLPTKTLILQ